ncbi:hypothetical protein PTTG_26513 [Puccinia triticina 1-1 BBBD Race 1]|uniref:Uncharacterized protein n=1 Tax=Puccinia triticina (isolate 1-1 / race 1 (BBBD)) TaxID=630390 RepID=A0A180GSZ9_PUCT1|nr:hypothetical protein PTTG_26513 [Puccinia triticina 1-1 BBBD Race 1]
MSRLKFDPSLNHESAREQLCFWGKFKAKFLQLQLDDSEFKYQATRLLAILTHPPKHQMKQIAIDLRPSTSECLPLEDGEFYNLQGKISVLGTSGNAQFPYSSAGMQHKQFTRFSAIPQPVRIEGFGIICCVRYVDLSNQSTRNQGCTDNIELTIGHRVNVRST